jgi:hypothetical protein
MRTLLSIPISLILYLGMTRLIAGPLAGMYSIDHERIGVTLAFIMIFAFSFISGYSGGYMARERFGPLFAGILAAIYILTYNDATLISKAIFYAPYANLASDDVLLGLSIVLFTFLWGGKLGEQAGFRKDRSHLLPEGV